MVRLIGHADLAQKLRYGLALRRPDLATFLQRDIKNNWHIANDEPVVVRAKAIWQVLHCLGRLLERHTWDWDVAVAAYNIVPDDPANDRKLLERIERAATRHGRSRRTAERRLKELDDELTRLLTGILPVPPEPDLRRIVARERALRPPAAGRGPLESLIPAVHGRGWDSTVAALLDTAVHVPVGAEGNLIVGTTRSAGKWAYAFTRHELLVEFQRATQPNWAGRAEVILGSALVNRVHRTSYYVGLLVNPPARKDKSIENTLGIDPLRLARLVVP
jgi:hypothetical protein